MEWEAQDEGFLAKILVPAGTKDVAVGTPVAVTVEDKDDVSHPHALLLACHLSTLWLTVHV